MSKTRVLTLAVGVLLLLTVASSVRADSVRFPPGQEKLNLVEGQTLISLADGQTLSFEQAGKVDLSGLLAEHFSNNNGKHLGFSVSAFNGGVKFGLANPRNPHTTVTQNPEPTGMLLLGTGLAAAAAFARRRTRRRRHMHQ
jgi:hypothetical protein